MKAIGRRVPVDLKSLWAKETNFSDWLTTTKGMDLLVQDLEIQIENPVRETRGNNFPCDIVANMVGDEKHVVVIENQFGRRSGTPLNK